MKRRTPPAQEILEDADASLLDVIDNVLNKGVVVTGEVVLGVAKVDLVYLRLSALLCAADRLLERREPPRRAVRVRLRPR